MERMESDQVVPTCSRCGQEPVRAAGQRWGRSCHAAANRKHRAGAPRRMEEEIARRVAEQLSAEAAAAGRFGR